MPLRDYADSNQPKKKSFTTRFLIVGISAIVILSAAGYFYITGDNKDAMQAPTAELDLPQSELPSRPEETWNYIHDLETREISPDGQAKTELSDEQKKELEALKADEERMRKLAQEEEEKAAREAEKLAQLEQRAADDAQAKETASQQTATADDEAAKAEAAKEAAKAEALAAEKARQEKLDRLAKEKADALKAEKAEQGRTERAKAKEDEQARLAKEKARLDRLEEQARQAAADKEEAKREEKRREEAKRAEQAKAKEEKAKEEKTASKQEKGGRFGLQCGAFRDRKTAENMQARLAMAGFNARINQGGELNRVVVGPVGDRSSANNALSNARSVADCVLVTM